MLSFDESMVVYPNEEETLSLCRELRLRDTTMNTSPPCQPLDLDCNGTYGLLELHLYAPAPRSSVVIEPRLLMNTLLDLYCYRRIIHACPVLEELTIGDGEFSDMLPICGGTFVEHASIKRLVIVTPLDYFENARQTIRFQAPSLVYLDYSSFVFKRYEVDDLDSLVEAKAQSQVMEPTYIHDVTCLVAAIRNITTLHLAPDSLESNKQKGWEVMSRLLKSCPNLQTLVFKGLAHKITNRPGDACPCSPSQKRRKRM
ncbi:hypothetical protein N665_0298s0018 [Sinapis alba]|nr:hypothetical protein N665_0298s0018 [Sinapis alba]